MVRSSIAQGCNKTHISNFNFHAPTQILWPLTTIHDKPFAPIRNHSWVDITHCGGSKYEKSGAWFYAIPGSGTRINIGRTIAFRSHNDASLHFIGKPCSKYSVDHLKQAQCNDEIPRFNSIAHARGYTSIQFLRHCDARCHGCGHEIVMLGIDGSSHCPLLAYRDAFNISCTCTDNLLRSRRGYKCGTCPSALRTGAFVGRLHLVHSTRRRKNRL